MRSLYSVESPYPLTIARLAQREPYAPRKRLFVAMHRYFEAPSNKELTLVDDTVVAPQRTTAHQILCRYLVVAERSFGTETRHPMVEFVAGCAQERECHRVAGAALVIQALSHGIVRFTTVAWRGTPKLALFLIRSRRRRMSGASDRPQSDTQLRDPNDGFRYGLGLFSVPSLASPSSHENRQLCANSAS